MKRFVIVSAIFSIMAAQAIAVSPEVFLHRTEADFAGGKFDNTAVNSLGEISLARKVQVLVFSQDAPVVVSDVVQSGRDIYAASGVSSVIYRIRGGKFEKYAILPGTMIGCLLASGDKLLAGVCGDQAGVYEVDSKGESRPLWTDGTVEYVWSIIEKGGTLYVATGPKGKIFAVRADGKADEIYSAGDLAKNILCLASDGKKLLYAGTDENGLVVEINLDKKTSRILLDAEEKEIAAIAADDGGGIYAATSDAARATPDGQPQPSVNAGSRAVDAGVRIPTSMPAPQPPKKPEEPSDDEAGEDKSAGNSAAEVTAKVEPVTADEEEPEVQPASTARMMAARLAAMRAKAAVAPVQPGAGNAVYHVGGDGLVKTVFRRNVTILDMIEQQDLLVLATGNGGTVYCVWPAGDKVTQLANTEASQITALAAGENGAIVFATANKGSVCLLEGKIAAEGSYTSSVVDAKQIAKWGTIKLGCNLPAGSKLALSTRTGNVQEPSDATWSAWSDETSADSDFAAITSPAGRFMQYRLKFAAIADKSPMASEVGIISQVANLPPVFSELNVTASANKQNPDAEAEGPKTYRVIEIKATDPNRDKMVYKIQYRQDGAESWITIAENQAQPRFVWDSRTTGDGIYHLRAIASDSPSNPPTAALEAAREYSPVVVDNAAPLVGDLSAAVEGKAVRVSGLATDASSRITAIYYSVDSAEDWIAVMPSDGLCDSRSEKFAFLTDELSAGAHRIAVRVEDEYGNLGYQAITVNAGK